MKKSTLALLKYLTEMKPLNPEQSRSWFEAKVLRVTNALRWVGGGMFLLMLLFVAPVLVWPGLRASQELALVVRTVGLLSTLCAMLWLILDMLPGIATLVFARKCAIRRQMLDAEQDLTHVESLAQEGLATLQFAKQWISIEMDRVNARLAMMFGSPDKVAMVSLAALGWNAWKESHALGADWISTLAQFVLAFLGGAAIGALFARDRLAQLAYQRDLLSMAISQLEPITMGKSGSPS